MTQNSTPHSCVNEKEKCRQIFENVILSLDGCLDRKEEESLMEEIKNNPCCLEKLNIHKAFKEFLCSRLNRKPVSPVLIESIKTRVQEISIQQHP